MDPDSAWQHAQKLYRGNKGKAYAKCIYCGHEVQGVTRLKYHLGKVRGVIKVCPSVPDAVSQAFRANFEPDGEGTMRLKMEQNPVPRVED